MLLKCHDLSLLNGIEALRMNFLYDGCNNEDLKIPIMDIFFHNNYKKYTKVNLSIEKLNKIIQYNSTLKQK
jgi:hypothetical protein